METIFLPIADFLSDLYNSLQLTVESDDGFQQPTIALAGFALAGVLLLGLRQIMRWLTRTDSKAREEMRAAQRACTKAEEVLADTENRVDELRRYDPELFLQAAPTARV